MVRIDIRPAHSSKYAGRMGAQSLLKLEENLSSQKGNMAQEFSLRLRSQSFLLAHPSPATVTCKAPLEVQENRDQRAAPMAGLGLPVSQLGVAPPPSC